MFCFDDGHSDIQSNSLVGPYLDPINATALQVLMMKGNTFTGRFPTSQAPLGLISCQLDRVPTASCPPPNIITQSGTLANKCQLTCGKVTAKASAHEPSDRQKPTQATNQGSTSSALNQPHRQACRMLVYCLLLSCLFLLRSSSM